MGKSKSIWIQKRDAAHLPRSTLRSTLTNTSREPGCLSLCLGRVSNTGSCVATPRVFALWMRLWRWVKRGEIHPSLGTYSQSSWPYLTCHLFLTPKTIIIPILNLQRDFIGSLLVWPLSAGYPSPTVPERGTSRLLGSSTEVPPSLMKHIMQMCTPRDYTRNSAFKRKTPGFNQPIPLHSF